MVIPSLCIVITRRSAWSAPTKDTLSYVRVTGILTSGVDEWQLRSLCDRIRLYSPALPQSMLLPLALSKLAVLLSKQLNRLCQVLKCNTIAITA